MADDDRRAGGPIAAYVDRVRYPRLVATVGLGLALAGAAALVYPSRPVLAVRVGFVGAVLALFGLSGLVAFLLGDAADRARGSG